MIQEFVERFQANSITWDKHPDSYLDIVKKIVEILTTDEYESIDPERIHQIDDGDYQGTLLFIIGAKGYQPEKYWYVKIAYGSCSGCDTLEAISCYSNNAPIEDEIKDYNLLALHIVQNIKVME